MPATNYALRLQKYLKAAAERISREQGTTLNQFINVAVAEKISALETLEFFRERAKNTDIKSALKLLEGIGRNNAPIDGDEV